MADQFFKIRNTYLGIDGDKNDEERSPLYNDRGGDNSTVMNGMDHSENMIQTSHRLSGNSYLKGQTSAEVVGIVL